MKDNERQISQNWPLGSLEQHRKKDIREESKPLSWDGQENSCDQKQGLKEEGLGWREDWQTEK